MLEKQNTNRTEREKRRPIFVVVQPGQNKSKNETKWILTVYTHGSQQSFWQMHEFPSHWIHNNMWSKTANGHNDIERIFCNQFISMYWWQRHLRTLAIMMIKPLLMTTFRLIKYTMLRISYHELMRCCHMNEHEHEPLLFSFLRVFLQ